jgi:hypothetical protein
MRYPVVKYTFEPNLSVLDALMWCSPGEVRGLLRGASTSLPETAEES